MSNSSTRNSPYSYNYHPYQGYHERDLNKKYLQQNYRPKYLSDDQAHSAKDSDRQTGKGRAEYNDQPCIKIESKPRILIVSSEPKSQIRDHFVFNRIKIDPNCERQLIQSLKDFFSRQYGAVSHLSKSSESKPGSLIMKLGFETDLAAKKALKGKVTQMNIYVDEKPIKISGQPTVAFDAFLKYQNSKSTHRKRDSKSSSNSSERSRSRNKRTQSRNRRDSRKNYRSNSFSSPSSSESSDSSRNSSREKSRRKDQRKATKSRLKKYQISKEYGHLSSSIHYKKNQRKEISPKKALLNSKDQGSWPDYPTLIQMNSSSYGKEASKVYKPLIFWGLPVIANAKKVDEYLQKHRDGCFISKKELAWKKIDGSSVCQVLYGQFEQRMAQKLLRTQVPIQIDGYPFIIIDSDFSDNKKYVEKLSEYQININLPTKVEPYYVMKSMNQCGKIIQVVSNNKFTEDGLSDSYNITFASKEVCKKFKAIKKTSKGIQIYAVTSVDDFVPIYRQIPKPVKKQQQMDEQKKQEQDGKISVRFSASPSRRSSSRKSP